MRALRGRGAVRIDVASGLASQDPSLGHVIRRRGAAGRRERCDDLERPRTRGEDQVGRVLASVQKVAAELVSARFPPAPPVLLAEAQRHLGMRVFCCVQGLEDPTGDAAVTAVAVAWLKFLPCKPLIVTGTTKPERVAQAVAGLSVPLTRTQWFAILEASRGASVP